MQAPIQKLLSTLNAVPSKMVRTLDAVKQSIKNLILTNHYERPFHPEIGSNLRAMLFENMTPQMNVLISRQIEELIQNYEPRARLIQVKTLPLFDRNAYRVLPLNGFLL